MRETHCLAIDLGGTNTKLAIVDSKGNILWNKMLSTQDYPSFSDFSLELSREFENALSNYAIVGIGLGCPNYNNHTQCIENAPNLPWKNVDIKKILQDLSSVPVHIEKDAPLAALGESYYGSHDSEKNFAVLTIGTGIGSGLVINGHLFHTPHGFGSEAGHLIVGEQKRLCGCQGYDHLESFSSVTALRAKASEVFKRKVSFTELKDLYLQGDKHAVTIIDEAAYYLAVGISQIVNLIGSKKIILAGGGISLGQNFLQKIQEHYQKICFKVHSEIDIAYSSLPINHGALLGAAALVFQDHHP